MKYFAIPADRVRILTAIEKEGWDAEAVGEKDLDWWLDEAYELVPRFRPSAGKAYLLFSVDPHCGLERESGKQGWVASVCKDIPEH